jgi:hypothetical protein
VKFFEIVKFRRSAEFSAKSFLHEVIKQDACFFYRDQFDFDDLTELRNLV